MLSVHQSHRLARPLTFSTPSSPTTDVDGWLSIAKSTPRPGAHYHASHASRADYLSPSPTSYHLGEHAALTQMPVSSSHHASSEHNLIQANICVWGKLGYKFTGHSSTIHNISTCKHIHLSPQHVHSFIALHSFLIGHLSVVAQKNEGEREKAGGWDAGECNWESSSLSPIPPSGLICLLVPEDRMSDQWSQASGWQDVTLWQKDAHVKRPSTWQKMYYPSGLKMVFKDSERPNQKGN